MRQFEDARLVLHFVRTRNASSSSRRIAFPRDRRSSFASLSICASRAAGSLKLTPTDSDWRPRRRCPLGVLLLIWEGQPPHGCQAHWQNSTQHPLAARLKKIQRRLFDLLPVIRNHVYHPAFAGSYSLKAVLPVLVPEMTYVGMDVANGTDAGLAWESLARGSLDQSEQDRIKRALLDYCGQDTLALVRLVEKLQMHH